MSNIVNKNLSQYVTRRFKRTNIRIIQKVTQEYEEGDLSAFRHEPNESANARRKRMIRYLYYDPTLSQKIAIWKAKFFATGWIWVATAISTYIALNGLHYANRHFEKGRYNI